MSDTEQMTLAMENQGEPRIIADLPYTSAVGFSLLLDLNLPAEKSTPSPVILWICGGGWMESDKSWAPFSSLLVANGFATASLRYRTSGEAIAPANIHDCKAAVRWLRANASRYHLDPDRIGVWGSSAGGHLAALLGTSTGVCELEGEGGHAEFSSAVQAVCDFCGSSDLTRIALPEVRTEFELLYQVTEKYLGGPVAERRDLARLVSPLTYVTRDTPPMLIVHGLADDIVPAEESLALYDALRKAGANGALELLPGVGHVWDFAALTDEKVMAFFQRELSEPLPR